MSDLDEGGEVILFPKVKDGADAITPPVERVRRDLLGCRHRRKTVLDKEAHRLTCADCGQELDCFDWIYDYSGRWESANSHYRQAVQQWHQAARRVEELLRVEKNAKARARKAGVHLTQPQARTLREALFGLSAILQRALVQDGPVDRAWLDRRLVDSHLDPAEIRALIETLDDAVELRDREGTAA